MDFFGWCVTGTKQHTSMFCDSGKTCLCVCGSSGFGLFEAPWWFAPAVNDIPRVPYSFPVGGFKHCNNTVWLCVSLWQADVSSATMVFWPNKDPPQKKTEKRAVFLFPTRESDSPAFTLQSRKLG